MVRVKNDSTREGDEVVQVYASRALRAFERIHLRAGETREIRLPSRAFRKGK